MVIRLVVLVSALAIGLALAACAETGSAMATLAAEQAAEIAATQAEMATTQAIDQLETATSRMSRQVASGQAFNLPSMHKGNCVLIYPNVIIVQRNGHRWILLRSQIDIQSSGDVLPNNLQNPEQP